MINKHFTLIGLVVAVILFTIATFNYPGGSQLDKNAIGFSWQNNYICNLLAPQAINGLNNPARPWAIGGMFFMSISFAVFYIRFSKRILHKHSSAVIKYGGAVSSMFTFFAFTSYHDIMLAISGTLSLLCIFYLVIFLFQAKLFFFGCLAAVTMLAIYFSNYIYGTGHLIHLLPVMQKVSFLLVVLLILSLQYFTTSKDFAHIKLGKAKKG